MCRMIVVPTAPSLIIFFPGEISETLKTIVSYPQHDLPYNNFVNPYGMYTYTDKKKAFTGKGDRPPL